MKNSSNQNSYYQVEDPQTLEQIKQFFNTCNAFYDEVRTLCEHFGFKNHITHDSIQFGVKFLNLVADKNDHIDLTLWKTSNHKRSGMKNVLPRASAKEHKAIYESMKPKTVVDYQLLTNLIIKDNQETFRRSYGYKFDPKTGSFMFETSLEVKPVAIEVLASKYHNFLEKDKSEDKS